jgi:hypothetical protein
MKRGLLIVFAKEPMPGKVKTRLAEDIGGEEASALYDLMLREVLKNAVSPKYETAVYKTAESDEAFFKRLLPGAVVRNQPEGDLGERMSRAFYDEFARGYGKICIVGTDCPGVSSIDLKEAFDLLEKHELVLGPSFDGGYYLIGLSVFHKKLFEGIAWSTGSVFDATVEKACFMGIRYACVSARIDVDDIVGLKKFMAENPDSEIAGAFERILTEYGRARK